MHDNNDEILAVIADNKNIFIKSDDSNTIASTMHMNQVNGLTNRFDDISKDIKSLQRITKKRSGWPTRRRRNWRSGLYRDGGR